MAFFLYGGMDPVKKQADIPIIVIRSGNNMGKFRLIIHQQGNDTFLT